MNVIQLSTGDGSPAATGEQALWIAVLSGAVHDATMRLSYMISFNSIIIRENARTYLRGDSNDFKLVCDYAGVQPDYVRALLERAIAGDKHEARNNAIAAARLAEAKKRLENTRANKAEAARREAARLARANQNIQLQRAIAAVLAGQGELFAQPSAGNGV